MKRLVENVKRRAQHWFPDRQLLLHGPGRVKVLKLSHRTQLAAVGVLAASLLWGTTTTLSTTYSWFSKAKAAYTEKVLRHEVAQQKAQLKALDQENALMAQERNQAQAQASQAKASAQAQVNALNLKTQAAIGQVETIIRSTGLNPGKMGVAATPAKADATASTANGAELLQQDLGQLQSLDNLLTQVPLASPVASISVSSPFGYRPDPWTGVREFHVGVDLTGPVGTPIRATAPGVVSFAGTQTGYGLIVIVDHGYGLTTRYSHLSRIEVSVGEHVGLHELVGLMGNTGWSTGPHLLYETRFDGQPVNPLQFIK